MELNKIAFGGGCHWCTEAVFQSLVGVLKVEQGWVSSTVKNHTFSEAVVVHFDDSLIDLKTLINIHLLTHKSTSNHSMRSKYRSAIYYFSNHQKENCNAILTDLQPEFEYQLITKIIPFREFKPSEKAFQNYYLQNPKKPFCEKYIIPKLSFLEKEFKSIVKKDLLLNYK